MGCDICQHQVIADARITTDGDISAAIHCSLSMYMAFSWAIYSLVIKKVSSRYSATFITRKVFFYGILTVIPMTLMAYIGSALILLGVFIANLKVKEKGVETGKSE